MCSFPLTNGVIHNCGEGQQILMKDMYNSTTQAEPVLVLKILYCISSLGKARTVRANSRTKLKCFSEAKLANYF